MVEAENTNCRVLGNFVSTVLLFLLLDNCNFQFFFKVSEQNIIIRLGDNWIHESMFTYNKNNSKL